jgi:hypothetical protein
MDLLRSGLVVVEVVSVLALIKVLVEQVAVVMVLLEIHLTLLLV